MEFDLLTGWLKTSIRPSAKACGMIFQYPVNLYQRSVMKYSFLDVAHPPARVFAPAGGCGNSTAIMIEGMRHEHDARRNF
jgi:hypothetical protein